MSADASFYFEPDEYREIGKAAMNTSDVEF